MSAPRPRSQAREAALKALYLLDLRPEAGPEELDELLGEEVRTDEARKFARALVDGTRQHQAAIDREVETVAHNWKLRRMAVVDRNVIRIGAYELLFCRGEIPPAVAIDEAVTIAKKFSSRESGAFVNGILDKIRERSAQAASPTGEAGGVSGEGPEA